MTSAVLPAAGPQAVCGPEEAFCAPCGSSVAGLSVAISFSYEFFEVIELHSEFEVRKGLQVGFGGLAHFRRVTCALYHGKPPLCFGCCSQKLLCLLMPQLTVATTADTPLDVLSSLQRYRPVLTEEFFTDLRLRGIDVTAVRIEPGACRLPA